MPPTTGAAEVFTEADYGGASLSLDVGSYSLAALNADDDPNNDVPDNAISSLKVAPGYQVILYTRHDFTGTSKTFTADDPSLIDDGLNNNVSSLTVAPAGADPSGAQPYSDVDHQITVMHDWSGDIDLLS
ncbi:hypothetical protein [Kitasatospora sp. NPDC001095]